MKSSTTIWKEKVVVKERLITKRRQNNNLLGSKYRIIRNILYRLYDANKDEDSATDQMLIGLSVRISNVLYGNELISANEQANSYIRPATPNQSPFIISDALFRAQK